MKRYYLLTLSLVLPVIASAQNRWTEGLFPCKNPPNCSFNDLVALAQGVASALIRISFILAPFLLMYVGFLYLTSQDNPAKRSQANKFLKNAVIGLAIMLSAYLIVKLALVALLRPDVLQTLPFDTTTR